MCGIAGRVGGEQRDAEPLIEALRHRGPDASGVVDLPEWCTTLAHTRLAILDLEERSHQPFASPCGHYLMTFNGEIYNYLELRERLEGQGCQFRTSSDTEVLLHWLVRHGPDGLPDLDGAFALAFIDRREGRLLLARDALGEKPLYFAQWSSAGEARLAFASEIGALCTIDGIDRDLDRRALTDWLRFLYTPAPRTLMRGIEELPPGHRAVVDLKHPSVSPERWYDLEARTAEPLHDRASALWAIREAFEEGLARRLRSDAPVGLYLSAGMDSNAILGAAVRQLPDQDWTAFTAQYGGPRDEVGQAALIAKERGVQHRIVACDEGQFHDSLERSVKLFGGPFGNATSIAAERLASVASRSFKVALVGDGGDELAAGYPRHAALAAHARLATTPAPLRRALQAGTSLLPERGGLATKVRRLRAFTAGLEHDLAQAYVDWSTYVGAEEAQRATTVGENPGFARSLEELFRRNAADPLRAAALVDLTSFVPFNLLQAADRTGMAHALELRVPFLTPRLVETALRIPARHKMERGRTKPLLADALADLLPAGIECRPKRAFNPPIARWLRRHAGALREHLAAPSACVRSVLEPGFVESQLRAFEAGRCDNSTLLWGLATLESWLASSVLHEDRHRR